MPKGKRKKRSEARDNKTAKIRLGYACNQDCLFCECRAFRKISASTKKQAATKVMLAKEAGYDRVVFTGGEAAMLSLFPHFPVLLALAKKISLQTGVITNGQAFAEKTYAKKIHDIGLDFVQLSLHADRSKEHDALVGGEYFEKAWRGLINLHRLGVEVLVNFVLTKKNMHRLTPLLERLMPFAPLRVKASFIEPKRLDEASFEALVPTLAEAKEAIGEAFSFLDNQPNLPEGFQFFFSGLPLCHAPRRTTQSFDNTDEALADFAESFDATFKPREYAGRVKPEICNACKLSNECLGVWEEYLQRRGSEELIPIQTAISNSFAYHPAERLARFSPSDCPIKRGEVGLRGAKRKVLIEEDGRMQAYQTDTGDFTEEQIHFVKHELGQIYLDVSGALFHEDFQTDMQKLSADKHCASCEQFTDCAGVYRPFEGGNVFAAAERELLALVDGLKGRLLDVGGGPVRYADKFSALIEKGAIDYWIVEPDPAPPLERFLKKHALSKQHFVGRVEDYRAEENAFDWILVLRSHNHFFAPSLAYEKIARWLKPTGRLLVVDNTAYGILRNLEIWEKIEQQGGCERFEHFNNHTSQEAIPFIENAGLTLVEHHPITPDTANQWWCLFKKP